MIEKDFIYYTDREGSGAYAQDAPSIQAHTHTHKNSYTLYFILYYSLYCYRRIEKNVYKRENGRRTRDNKV